jgi:hypothetical protein
MGATSAVSPLARYSHRFGSDIREAYIDGVDPTDQVRERILNNALAASDHLGTTGPEVIAVRDGSLS